MGESHVAVFKYFPGASASPQTLGSVALRPIPPFYLLPPCSSDHRLPEWLLEASSLHLLLQQVGMQPVAPDAPDHS